ncbi:hypothetical protein Scep_001110 [Stephania cephalantha]|uniref:Uncharacterized protein n=1 Tax=Stephania cephalantha TaxID=152367 RepID=A0AAP0LB50_9MAGN
MGRLMRINTVGTLFDHFIIKVNKFTMMGTHSYTNCNILAFADQFIQTPSFPCRVSEITQML